MRPSDLRRVIRDAGRPPAERSTLYRTIRSFPLEPAADELDALDAVDDADERFGSYEKLTRDPRFRFSRA
jgi:FO synthase subunit 2